MAGGEINAVCKGKTINYVAHDDDTLRIVLADGHEIVIEWRAGEPVLKSINVRAVLPSIMARGLFL
jgi:hypothetical protein